MNGIIIFNNANDIVFKKLNDALGRKIREIAVTQGLIAESLDGEALEADQLSAILDNNVILQIFSPIMNSQKIMFCQFDNSYTTFKCDTGFNMAFGEFLGYAFLKIGNKPIDQLRRSLTMSISFTKHLCGTNLSILQTSNEKEELLNELIDNYDNLYENDQGILLQAMSQLLTNSDIKTVVRRTLDLAIGKLEQLNFTRTQAIMCVKNKFVSISSGSFGQKLSVTDTLFILLLSRTLECKNCDSQTNKSLQIFLDGNRWNPMSGCIPSIVHLSRLDKGVMLILIVEYGNLQVSKTIYDTFFALQKILNIQMQSDLDNFKQAFDNLEMSIKLMLDALKKAKLKGDEIESSHKKFALKWDNLKKMYSDIFKVGAKDLLVRIESNMPGFQEELKELFNLTSMNTSSIANALEKIPEVCTIVDERLLEFSEFLSVKADCNLSMESYFQEFPGLVHFMYVNRFDGIMIAPDLCKDSTLIPKENIWKMVDIARSYLRKGQTSVMWKDTTFNYSYFLWFEDFNSGAVKPNYLQNNFTKTTTEKMQNDAGVLSADYYQYLTEITFPKSQPGKYKCYEIFCIHLGLVTATCVAEHSRRLVATIADIIQESADF